MYSGSRSGARPYCPTSLAFPFPGSSLSTSPCEGPVGGTCVSSPPVTWQQCLVKQKGKNHVYALPFETDIRVMFLNRGALAAAGVGASAVPKTWAQLMTVAQKLESSNAVPGGKPACIDPDWARLLAFVYQNKGSFLNSKKTAPTVTSAAVDTRPALPADCSASGSARSAAGSRPGA